MGDRIECDQCGSLNIIGAKACSLCGDSLAEEEERRRAGDVRILVPVALVTTIAWIALFIAVLSWFGVFGVSYDYYRGHSMESVAALALIGLGMLVVAFWRGAWRAWELRAK